MQIIEIFTIIAFFLGFYGLITTSNVIKSIVFIVVMEVAVIVFFLSIGFGVGVVPPIAPDAYNLENVAAPLTQALMITAVVVGLATTAINITMFITLFRKHRRQTGE